MGSRGFTILELLAALAVASILVLAASGTYVFMTRAAKDNDAQAYLQRQATLVMDEMARQIRPATSLLIVTCGPGSGIANSLLITQADGTKYCFRSDAAGSAFWRDHYAPGGTTPDGSWNMLTGAPVTLSTASGPGFAVDINSRRAVITFELQYQIPGSQSFQTMKFGTTIARRNAPSV